MAQINLLKQSKPSKFAEMGLLSIISKIIIVVLLMLAGYYGWLFFQLRNLTKASQDLDSRIANQKQQLSTVNKKDEVLARQAQLKEFGRLIDAHVYWSGLLPELAKVTFKNANYLSFRVDNQGGISLSLQVPSLVELDEFLQVFDSPKLNKYFSDVRIGGINKAEDKRGPFIRVDVQLKFDESLLKFKPKGK